MSRRATLPQPTELERAASRPRCSVEGCTAPARSRGLCNSHYQVWLRTGTTTRTRVRPAAYGSGRVKKKGYVWVLRPGHPLADSAGYVAEHRLVLHDQGITIPVGWHVHHKNGIKDDSRPENLEVLSPAEHRRRHLSESCKHGHPLTPDNVKIKRDGSRACIICLRASQRRYRESRGITGPANSEKTHCKRGHEYTPENTRYTKRGTRTCKECDCERQRRRYRGESS